MNITAAALRLLRFVFAAILATTLASCSSSRPEPAAVAPIIYAAPVPLDYDLEPMARSLRETAYNVQAVPYQAWREHSEAVARGNAARPYPAPSRICGPLYGSADIYCH